MSSEKIRRVAANSIFPSLFLGAFGCVLAQAWVAQLNGSWLTHLILGMPGMSLAALALYRARLHWAAGLAGPPGRSGPRRLSFGARDFACYLALFATGIAIAMSAGSLVLLGVVASLMYLVPWATIPVCRSRFLASSVVTLAGAIACLAFSGKPMYLLHYVVAAWTVLIPAMAMIVLVLVALPYGYRLRELAPGATWAVP